MRVIAGTAKGRRLRAPKGLSTRPTSDAVREATFNSLQSLLELEDATVADLFAGSGAMGIEALSRGARHCTFVESDRAAVAAIQANLETTGFAPRGNVLRADAALREITADVVFADPPYAFDGWEALATRINAEVFVAESDRELHLGDRWLLVRCKRYGATVVSLFTPGVAP